MSKYGRTTPRHAQMAARFFLTKPQLVAIVNDLTDSLMDFLMGLLISLFARRHESGVIRDL